MSLLSRLGFVCLTLFLCLSLQADTKLYVLRLDLKVLEEDTGKGLMDATVDVYVGDELVASHTTDLNGVIPKFEIPAHKIYKVYFKKNAFVTKLVEIDSRTEHVKNPFQITLLRMEPTLFRAEPGIDLSFLDTTALVKYKFDKNGVMNFDQKYTAGILEKINTIREGN